MDALLPLSPLTLGYFFLAALIVGFTKTSVGGMGILAVLLMALAFPGKASPGILLPMLVVADIFAVIYYRRSCQWHVLVKIFPLTAIGIVIGYFIVDLIPFHIFQIVLGIIILAMLGMEVTLSWAGSKATAPVKADMSNHSLITYITGLIAGIATMIANAAGPIFGIYMLRMGLKKAEFVGTRSWFFLIINLFKLPFSANLGLITTQSLTLNLLAVPVILLGAWAGYLFLKLIDLTMFKWLIRAAVLFAAIRLILS